MNIKRRTFTKWLLGLFALPWIPKIASGDYWPTPKPEDYDTSPVEPAYLVRKGPEWISWEEYQRTHKGSRRGRLDTFRFIENHRNL